jgi:hypothetical protein
MAKKNKRHHAEVPASPSVASREADAGRPPKLKRKAYEREMRRLHGELVAMQEWVKASGAKLCVVFEGRDTAGKGARSSGSPSASARGCSGSSPCPPRPSASSRRCTSTGTSRTSRLLGRW